MNSTLFYCLKLGNLKKVSLWLICAHSFIAYSTRLGVAWWYINFIFRAVVSMSGLAKNLYSDALKEMSCDTKLPGCKECCHAIFQAAVVKFHFIWFRCSERTKSLKLWIIEIKSLAVKKANRSWSLLGPRGGVCGQSLDTFSSLCKVITCQLAFIFIVKIMI